MIYKISGEQPFQVLSDSFSVSPSESGYNLYISADGVNYSQFATVAANTTRQFTGMNNGNYYILSGNTSEVQVNWNRDCGGGGGGGYVLPTATASRLGGVKIGSGINVASDGTISANGGGKTVVNFDSTTQAERATLYTTLKALYDAGSGNTINDTYAFYKTLNSNQGVPFDYYQFDSANTLILGAVVTSGNSTAYEQVLKITSDGSVTVSTNTVGGGAAGPTVINFDEMTQAERATLYSQLYGMTGSTEYLNENYVFFKTFREGVIQYRLQLIDAEYYGRIIFGTTIQNPFDGSQIWFPTVWLTSDGSFEKETIDSTKGVSFDFDETRNWIDSENEQPLVFNKATSAITIGNTTITTGNTYSMSGDLVWFTTLRGNWAKKWVGLELKVIDTNNEETHYCYPTTSWKEITPITVNGITFDKEQSFYFGNGIKITLDFNDEAQMTNVIYSE